MKCEVPNIVQAWISKKKVSFDRVSVTAFLSNICYPPKSDGFWMQEEKTRREKDMGTKVTLVHAALLLLIETGTKYKKKLLEEL